MKNETRCSERGSQSVSAFFAIPVIFLFFLLVLYAGVVGTAKHAVQSAANSAARDASLARTAGSGESAGEKAANRVLDQRGINCASSSVNIDTSQFAPVGTEPGTVRATVTCDVVFVGINTASLPGARTISADGMSPVDAFRER